MESFQGAMHDSEKKLQNAGAYNRTAECVCMYVYTTMCILSHNSRLRLTILRAITFLIHFKWSIGMDHVLLQTNAS